MWVDLVVLVLVIGLLAVLAGLLALLLCDVVGWVVGVLYLLFI